MTLDYKTVATEKALSLLNNIPKDWLLEEVPSADDEPNVNVYLDKILPENEREITNKTATELLELQKSGKLTAYEITFAFCHRAALVHQLTNCCTEIFFDLAFKTAKELDEYFIKNNKLIGKLHGIPISLKDQINLPGITTAIGYIAPHISEEFELKITHRKSRNDISLIAQILQNEGAVFYVKTTVPTAMLGIETSSNLGTTYNSIDRHNSCGGSSGGEAALIGGGGSIIGLGTDIGGSIRAPSSVQGIYGFRPSSNRFPYLDIANSYPNQLAVCSVVGPMCQNISDTILVSEAILSSPLCDIDPKHIPLPWDNKKLEINEKIKIGFLESDGDILPHPPIVNNIRKMKKLLHNSDEVFECISLDENNLPVKFSQLGKLLLGLYSTDGFEEIKQFCKLSGEPLSDLFQRCFDDPCHMDTVAEFCDKAGLKYQYQQQFDKIFQDVDCFIMPTFSTVCWKAGDNAKVTSFYTRALNILDYTVMSFPVGIVDKDDVGYERTSFNSKMDESNWKYFNLENQIGKPVSLQLVCKRYHEEQCCALVKKITELLKK